MQFVKFNSAFPSFFNHEYDAVAANTQSQTLPAVNVIETKEAFKLEVAAPGLKKEDFKLNVHGHKLVISASQENSSESVEAKYARKEFSYTSFQRVFNLPKTIDGEKIEAQYQDGILYVALPKKEEAVVQAREIAVV